MPIFEIVFHQVYSTILGFLIFSFSLEFFFIRRFNLVKDLRRNKVNNLHKIILTLQENIKLYENKSIAFNKVSSDKIENYVVNKIKSDEKVWKNELHQLNMEIAGILKLNGGDFDISFDIGDLEISLQKRY